ncbi:MAG TPA: sulfatase-like hydrolase/transferase, partial [Clostridia bacterium]
MTIGIKDKVKNTKAYGILSKLAGRTVECVSGLLKTVREFWENDERVKRVRTSKGYESICRVISDYWLLCFFVLLIIYLDTVYRFWLFRGLSSGYFFTVIFALSGGTAFYLVAAAFPEKWAKTVSIAATFLVTLVYGVQLVYYCIFRTPLSLISVGGAGDAMQFWDIALEAILKNIAGILLLFVPFVFLVLYRKKMVIRAEGIRELSMVLAFCVLSYSGSIACVAVTGDGPSSQNTLYFEAFSLDLSVDRLGVFTTMRLDMERMVTGVLKETLVNRLYARSEPDDPAGSEEPGIADGTGDTDPAGEKPDETPTGVRDPAGRDGLPAQEADDGQTEPDEPAEPVKPYNVMDIDFDTLMASGESDPLYPMHKYFSSVEPTPTNEYTGIFKGCNLIMFTAEGFSPYAVSPELTPTLYKMINEGFVFRNFYTPIWWVSTSDGEYVACTGLIPKGGVWSMAKSGSNYMPFVMGNQFRKLGYLTKAYHNHTYTYYSRDVSHPNMGYDYKGVGNGLEVRKTWPESDLEMIEATVGEYINSQPFHAYYMTVSGHMNYNFYGNQMASKNRKYV